MSLQGKIVCYNVPENLQHFNNGHGTCPALVVTDWNPKGETKEKALNLKVFYNGPEIHYLTSICHESTIAKSMKNEVFSWKLFE